MDNARNHEARYEYEINVLLEMAKTGVPIMEEEIETIYLDRDNSSSHFDTVRDSFRVYREILRFQREERSSDLKCSGNTFLQFSTAYC